MKKGVPLWQKGTGQESHRGERLRRDDTDHVELAEGWRKSGIE